MAWQQIVAASVGTAAILAASYAVARLVRDIALGTRKLARMVDDWLGEPERPGVPGSGRPSVLARLAAIEEGQRATREIQAEHGRQLAELTTRVARLEQELRPEKPRVEASSGLVAERAETADDDAASVRYGFR